MSASDSGKERSLHRRYLDWKAPSVPAESAFEKALWQSWTLPVEHSEFGNGLTTEQADVLRRARNQASDRSLHDGNALLQTIFDALPTPVTVDGKQRHHNAAFEVLLADDRQYQECFALEHRFSPEQMLGTLLDRARTMRGLNVYLPLAGTVFRVHRVMPPEGELLLTYLEPLCAIPADLKPRVRLVLCLKASGWANKEIVALMREKPTWVDYVSKTYRTAFLELRRQLFPHGEGAVGNPPPRNG